MKNDYQDIMHELIKKTGIPSSDIFDYRDTPFENIIEPYFQFCQDNLNIAEKTYGITPARIYIRTYFSVNAVAGKQNGYSLIGINVGTFPTLFNFFNEKSIEFLDKIPSLRDLNEQLDVPIDFLMFQTCCQFIYYHELAHLIQNAPELKNWLNEHYDIGGEDFKFTKERQAYEYDADLHAAKYVGFHVLDYWQRQNRDLQTFQSLEKLIGVAAASIFSYFLYLMGSHQDIYYSKTSHPHPLVRILYIMDTFIQNINVNLPINSGISSSELMRDTFEISDILFKLEGNNSVEKFRKVFLIEKENIEKYVNDILIGTTLTMTNLVNFQ